MMIHYTESGWLRTLCGRPLSFAHGDKRERMTCRTCLRAIAR